MLILHLDTEKAILLRDKLMVALQSSKPESRPEIQELLDPINTYLEIALRCGDNV